MTDVRDRLSPWLRVPALFVAIPIAAVTLVVVVIATTVRDLVRKWR